MKLTRENIYINLQCKSKEELTELKNILFEFKQDTFRENLISYYYENPNDYNYFHFDNEWLADSVFDLVKNKQEVTIQQLKEILQPMENMEERLRKAEILKKAEKIIQAKKDAEQHLQICLEADICPECGDDNLSVHRESNEDGDCYWSVYSCKCGFKREDDFYSDYD